MLLLDTACKNPGCIHCLSSAMHPLRIRLKAMAEMMQMYERCTDSISFGVD